MKNSTIEQILTKLASIDSSGELEVFLDPSIYTADAVQKASSALRQRQIASLTDSTNNIYRISATGRDTARLAIGQVLAMLLQGTVQSAGDR